MRKLDFLRLHWMTSQNYSVGGWVERLHLDTADTGSLDGSDLDVSSLTPGSTPGVSDEVVVLARLGSVSNSGHGVIEVCSAGSGVENTGGISLEDEGIGLNGDGGWSGSDGSLKLGNGVGLNVLVGLNGNLSGEGGVLACSIHGGVGVVLLEVFGLLLSILEGGILPSSIASIGGGVAVNELLLREGEEVSGGDEVSSLDGSSGGESPA